ncbi:MAG: hypothetical protein J0M16_12035, partial [Gammaproteobacteria bacterium]|nr:hypothetical protein [Gammaproteobacteria bacterium]
MTRSELHYASAALLVGSLLALQAVLADDGPAPVAPPDAAAVEAPAAATVDTEVQVLKDEVLDLNRELFLLEEELLFPANTQ